MKTWIKLLLTVIVTAGIVGGGTYYFLNKKATMDKKNLQGQIDDLNKKITDANTALTAAQAATTTTDPTAGWVRKTIPELKVEFDYPEKLGKFEYIIENEIAGQGTGSTMTAAIGGKQGSPQTAAIVNMYSQSKNFSTSLGRGTGFLDADGYEKTGNKYYVFGYGWTDGKKGTLEDASLIYTNPREVITKSFTALLVDGKNEEGVTRLPAIDTGAVIPMQSTSNYYAITVQADTSKIIKGDLLSLVKSVHSTN